MSTPGRSRGWWIIAGLVVALTILHQDVWLWGDRTLVFGVVPIGLAYHASFSVAAALVWALAVKIAWPRHIEQWADDVQEAP